MTTSARTCHRSVDVAAALPALAARFDVDAPEASASLVGALGEELAAQHLVGDHGLRVVARNWRSEVRERPGELDVVALDDGARAVVVVEVRARRDAARFGGARAALDARKLARVRQLALLHVAATRYPYRRLRIDVVAVDLPRQVTRGDTRSRPARTPLTGVLHHLGGLG